MSIGKITDFASTLYDKFPECSCKECQKYCSTGCSDSCELCLRDIHHASDGTARDYNCDKMLAYYICQNYLKYASEIQHIMNDLIIFNANVLNVLSIGCGAAPDYVGIVDFIIRKNYHIKVNYQGIEKNPRWSRYQEYIKKLYPEHFAGFYNSSIEDFKFDNQYKADLVILQYLFSTFIKVDGVDISQKFNEIFHQICDRVKTGGYIIINDVNSYYVGRDTIFKIAKSKQDFDVYGYCFENYPDSNQWFENKRKSQELFYMPSDNLSSSFDVNTKCSSAQIIMKRIR